LVSAAKFLVAATKNVFVVPNFVAVTKPFFPVHPITQLESYPKHTRHRTTSNDSLVNRV